MSVQYAGIIAEALNNIAGGLNEVAKALMALGTKDASTPYGAIESLSAALTEGLSEVAQALGNVNVNVDTAQ